MKVNYRPANSKRTEDCTMRPVSVESNAKDGRRTILVEYENIVRVAYYNDELKRWEVNGNKKAVFSLLLICLMFFCSCVKDVTPAPPVLKQFTVEVKGIASTFTQIFASNDSTAPANLWIYVMSVNSVGTYQIDFDGLVCNGILYADPKKHLYAAYRQGYEGNIIHSNVTIKRN